jgi:hypothetical protein
LRDDSAVREEVLAKSKVSDLRNPVVREKHVLRLQVSVDHVF